MLKHSSPFKSRLWWDSWDVEFMKNWVKFSKVVTKTTLVFTLGCVLKFTFLHFWCFTIHKSDVLLNYQDAIYTKVFSKCHLSIWKFVQISSFSFEIFKIFLGVKLTLNCSVCSVVAVSKVNSDFTSVNYN